MAESPCVLILGGTGDAAALAQACTSTLSGVRTLSSLAGRTRSPVALAGETHVGGFGGVQGLKAFMQERGVDLLVDATHPFAAQISQHAALACEALGIPRLLMLRKPWVANDDDHWIKVSDMADAADQLARRFAGPNTRVFLSTGRLQLSAFAHLRDAWFLIRTVDELDAPAPLARYQALVRRGPFTVDEERALLEKHQIGVLVSKNSGGQATYAKILAARKLSLPVIMLQRPPMPAGDAVYTVGAGVDWLQSHL